MGGKLHHLPGSYCSRTRLTPGIVYKGAHKRFRKEWETLSHEKRLLQNLPVIAAVCVFGTTPAPRRTQPAMDSRGGSGRDCAKQCWQRARPVAIRSRSFVHGYDTRAPEP